MQVHSRLNPMKQSTIGLPKFSSSLPLKCNMLMTIRGLFMPCKVGSKVGEKRWTNIWGFVELIAKKTMEQPTMSQIITKNINTLTTCNKVLATTKGNELNLPFICCFVFFPIFIYFYFSLSVFSFL